MNLKMAGVDFTTADVAAREPFAWTKKQAARALAFFREDPAVSGCVLICTCNRTELYLSLKDGTDTDAVRLLTQAAERVFPPADLSGKTEIPPFRIPCGKDLFRARANDAAVRHLIEVACGLCSALRGDDQISAQVRGALAFAREAGTADPVLETLFRLAVTAAKKVKTEVCLRKAPVSAASQAVERLKKRLGGLSGKRALVIGNGEMGRLSARLLVEAGCGVAVTLRTYRHGETVVPAGCRAIPYDDRLKEAARADILFSATASPHYTLTRAMLETLPPAPRQLIDLAVPRDVEPAAASLPGISYLGIDDLGGPEPLSEAQTARIAAVCEQYRCRFLDWSDGRMLRETADRLTARFYPRIAAEAEAGAGNGDDVAFAVRRTVESLLFSLKDVCPPDVLKTLREKTVQRCKP